MTELLRELRLRKLSTPGRIRANTPDQEKMQANMAKARAPIEANVLKDQLRAYEYGDTTDAATCFLCGTAISDDEAAVTTALGPIHQTCHEEYGQD